MPTIPTGYTPATPAQGKAALAAGKGVAICLPATPANVARFKALAATPGGKRRGARVLVGPTHVALAVPPRRPKAGV